MSKLPRYIRSAAGSQVLKQAVQHSSVGGELEVGIRWAMSNETRGRKRQPRLLPRGTAWLLFAVALGVYLDRLFQLMATLNVAISIGAAPSQSHDHLPAAGASASRQSSTILPKRLISVFGSEASGSTFLATTLGVASGAFPVNGTVVTLPSDRFNNSGRTIVERVVAKRARSPDGAIEIQHLSLPWGWWGTKKRNCNMHHLTLTVDAFVPKACFRFDYQSTWEHRMEEKAPIGCSEVAHISGKSGGNGWTCGTSNCGEGANEGYALYPRRFFVNITSHIEWYLQRGVDITAVLSVRDKTISLGGKTSTHCANETVAKVEEEQARSLMAESLRKYGRQGVKGNRVLVVSYETLMSLQAPYLFDTYKMLGIESDYIPEFKDGNEKYVKAK
ncbi:hypothetical protein ACHAXT_004014 [Thalassiosira profunda]